MARFLFFCPPDPVDMRSAPPVVDVLTLIRILVVKSVVTGQASVTLDLRNIPGKKHKQVKGVTRI